MEHAIRTEKYRPKNFDDIKGQEEIVKRVKALVKQKNLPHCLFSGPAGIGKTTLALVVARSLFGDEWHQNFLELNASDERGIDVIRSKVKDFARTKAMGDVPFKIIFWLTPLSLSHRQTSLRQRLHQQAGWQTACWMSASRL